MINIIIGKDHSQIAFKPSTMTMANTGRFLASVKQLSVAVINATRRCVANTPGIPGSLTDFTAYVS